MRPIALGTGANHFLVGGGIASLATAALLIREAGVEGDSICVIEQSNLLGGSLDGAGTAQDGFSTRGGRMFEPNFVCTFDLLTTIPSLDDPSKSVVADMQSFNQDVSSGARCRLVRGGRRVEDSHKLELNWSDKLAIMRLMAASEQGLAGQKIESWFGTSFFKSNFWLLWSTMFSFRPWHSLAEMRRYMRRFLHLLPGISSLSGVLRTRYNQYDSLIDPLQSWLASSGVNFRTGLAVTDIAIEGGLDARRVTGILLENGDRIRVNGGDRVYITLGSMTDASSLGSNVDAPARLDEVGPAWKLWKRLAQENRGLGHPETFCSEPGETAWHSFTVTLDRGDFHQFMEEFTGNATGTGGLVTFVDSNWLMSIVMFHQPHFRSQPSGSYTFWGYGLRGENPGNLVAKTMWDAAGNEIIAELAWHLRLTEDQKSWFDSAKILPCRIPFITSQFMPRVPGDRPPVRPRGAENFAVIGQFCEIEQDCVFTVEFSIRSAWEAVRFMTERCGPPPPLVRADRDPVSLLRAANYFFRN